MLAFRGLRAKLVLAQAPLPSLTRGLTNALLPLTRYFLAKSLVGAGYEGDK
jgi:hypothetical protein